jgi:hypothetical protein
MSTPNRPILRNIFAGDRVKVDPIAKPIAVPHGGSHDSMQVQLIREGSVVRAIEITCSCGQQLRLDCQYTAPDARS